MTDLFEPAWWLPGPHAQTLWAALIRPQKKISIRAERLELADGDFLDLAWVGHGAGPIVVVLHGLTGSVYSPYAQGILGAIKKKGWRGVFVHFRGCSGVPNRLARSYHSGETGDLQSVVSELIRRYPDAPIFAIGYSLGGNVLLKWLGETSSANPLCAAAAISIPFELHKTVNQLNRGFSRLYQWRLLRELSIAHQQKFKKISSPLAFGDLKKIKTFWEFDEQITAPLHGFADANSYYTQSSSRQYLSKIKIPTLILHARNDPFTPLDALPNPHEISASVSLELTEQGGHVGFVGGRYPWQPIYWLEQKIMHYFSLHLC